MSLAKFLMPLLLIIGVIAAFALDLPSKLVNFIDKALGNKVPRDADGNIIEDETDILGFGVDASDARTGANALNYANRTFNLSNVELKDTDSKKMKVFKQISRNTGVAGKVLVPFIASVDYAQEVGSLEDELEFIEGAYAAGELFKENAEGEAVPVTAEDMELYRLLYGAKSSSKFAEVLADHGTSLVTTLATAGAVALVTPAPGGRIAAAFLGLASLAAGAFVSNKLDDAGLNELVSTYIGEHFSREDFDKAKIGTVFENLSYEEAQKIMVDQLKQMQMQSENFNTYDPNNDQASLNMQNLNNQNIFEDNYYVGGNMDNRFIELSIDKAYT